MGKQSSGTAVVARKSKGKSAAQLAKKEANIRAAAERLRLLQERQRVANEMRKRGFVGSDEQLVTRAELEKNEEERRLEQIRAREFVDSVLSGPHGEKVKAFLGDRVGEASKIAWVVRNFLDTQGLA